MKRVMGIDEAGRGCVIGPMVLCGVVVRHDRLDALAEIGVRDSKALSPQRRESLCDEISAIAETSFIAKVSPRRIDRENINAIGLRETARMIDAAKPDEVYLDAPVRGCGIAKYRRKLRAMLTEPGVALVAENKADQNYPVVSAASIIAKVTRDNVIVGLHDQYGDFGSGYPSDRRTVKFVTECYARMDEFPDIVRQKWLTVRRLAAAEQCSFPFDSCR
jgi:ribonuclease HII